MKTTKLEYKETLGNCYDEGILEIVHDLDTTEELKQYLIENWFNLEDADRIFEVVISPYTDGNFNLVLTEINE